MSECRDALWCMHVACEPSARYLRARGHAAASGLLRAFEGWPTHHLAAIARARREREAA